MNCGSCLKAYIFLFTCLCGLIGFRTKAVEGRASLSGCQGTGYAAEGLSACQACSLLTQLLGQPRPGRLELLGAPLCPTDALMFLCADGLRSTVLEGFGIASPPCLIPSYTGKRDLFLKTSSGAWALCEGVRVLLSFHQRVSGLSGRLSFTSQRTYCHFLMSVLQVSWTAKRLLSHGAH